MRTINKRRSRPWSSRFLFLIFILMAALLLSGCVRYELGVQFDGPNGGTIAQQIKIGERLTRFSQDEAQNWLKTVERRARQLHGKVTNISDAEMLVTIPFVNGQDFVTKFDRFFNPPEATVSPFGDLQTDEPVQLASKIKLHQSNWLLWEQDRVNLEVDLRSLGVFSESGTIILDSGPLLDLEFALKTPWGARNSSQSNVPLRKEGRKLIWQLQPGQINEIEAAFWVPSSLGWGTVGIVLLMIGGFYVKYKSWPWGAIESSEDS